MAGQRASERIVETVTAWPGVVAGPGRRGELAFKVDGRELGHLHGDTAAHFAFSRAVWSELKREGRIEDHPIFPRKPGLGARTIENDDDIRDVIAMLRLNYDRVMAASPAPADAAA